MPVESASASPHAPCEVTKISVIITLHHDKVDTVLTDLLEWLEDQKSAPKRNILYANWDVTKIVEPHSGAI